MHNVRVRFPPSPTGYCHVGTARMAILNYLFARKHGGAVIFRSEDTDRARSTREFEEDIIEQLKWLGLDWDEFYRTTELVESHKAAMQRLIDEDKAYLSDEESKLEPGKMTQVVRLRNPGKTITFIDEIRGEITFDTTELGDFVIGRAIDDPLYHLAVVVDDASHGITHVIRGEDHISNTPRQILIQEALGFARPVYAHYPLLLGGDRSKLSKRTGDVAVRQYRERGFLPQALLNYIAILGWTPPSQSEILSLEEMIHQFDLKDLHKSGAVFDVEKLTWYNRHYLLALPTDVYRAYVMPRLQAALTARGIAWDERVGEQLLPLLKERVSVAEEIDAMVAAGELDFFFREPALEKASIPQKGVSAEETAAHLSTVHEFLTALPETAYTDPEGIKAALWEYASEQGRGNVLWPLRYALSGRAKSPDPFTIASLIGKEATLRRVSTAKDLVSL